jgi:hypothetical protein
MPDWRPVRQAGIDHLPQLYAGTKALYMASTHGSLRLQNPTDVSYTARPQVAGRKPCCISVCSPFVTMIDLLREL